MVKNMNSYTMEEQNNLAKLASEHIERYLNGHRYTVKVENVEEDPAYQKKDIDLLWTYCVEDIVKLSIEIKADRYHNTGNFFFETISNMSKNTPGCFLYTEADLIFYYFINIRTFYVLPTKEVRQWFINNIDKFEKKNLRTAIGEDGYKSEGRLVPIIDVDNTFNLKKVNISYYINR